VIVAGRTLIPARALFEGIGADISWDKATNQVNISMGDSEVVLTIDSKTAIVNGRETTLDVPPLIIDGRTMIPVRFAAESLGFEVNWENDTRTVEIAAPDKSIDENAPVPAAVKTSGTVYLPEELKSGSSQEPSKALEAFINTCSNKKVIFPENRTFVLERQLVIHDVENLVIDFNGCVIRMPDDCSWATRYDTGQSVDLRAVTIHDSVNVAISNYRIDGNSSNIDTDNWCVGLWLQDVKSFTSANGAFVDNNYHQIVIYGGTKDIIFQETYFRDHGGATGGAGISDVFVHNNSDDDFSFIGVEVDNTALRERQDQCFYIAGHNGYFENVVTNNCSVPLDIRYGKHIARDFWITNAERVLILQPYPYGNGSAGYARLTASNFTGKKIKGSIDGAAGLYIIGCDRCHLDDFDIEMDLASSNSWYGIRIRKYYSAYPVKEVVITNTNVENSSIANILMERLDASATMKNITATGAGRTVYGVKTSSCYANQYVEDLVAFNCIKYSSPDNMLVLR